MEVRVRGPLVLSKKQDRRDRRIVVISRRSGARSDDGVVACIGGRGGVSVGEGLGVGIKGQFVAVQLVGDSRRVGVERLLSGKCGTEDKTQAENGEYFHGEVVRETLIYTNGV